MATNETVSGKLPAAEAKPRMLGKTTLKRAGGSLIATVPAAARNLHGLTEGQSLAVSVEGNRVVMELIPQPAAAKASRVRRPRYTLEDLLEGVQSPTPRTDDESAWSDAEPAGRELW